GGRGGGAEGGRRGGGCGGGAGRVGAERGGGEAGGRGEGRAGRRARRRALNVPRIAARRKCPLGDGPTERELVHRELAEEHGARALDPPRDERVAHRDVIGKHA